MSSVYEQKLEQILKGTTNGYQLQLSLIKYCDLQVSEYDFDLFGILFFEKNPLISPFFISNSKEQTLTLLDVDRIPWKDNPEYWKDTVKLPEMKRKDPVKKEIRELTGMNVKSTIITPLLINEKMVGSIMIGYKRKRKAFKEGIVYLACISSIQVTEAIEKAVDNEAWSRSRLISTACYDYSVNKLSMKHEGNPYIVVEILKKVFDLRCVLIIRSDEQNRRTIYYRVTFNEDGEIQDIGTDSIKGNNIKALLKEKKIDNSYLEIPIKYDEEETGKIFLSYRNMDNVFKEKMREIVQPSALLLSGFML
jgi:hypothetical protein